MVLSIILNIVRSMITIWRKRVLKTFRLNTQMIRFIRLRSKKVLLARLFFYVSFDTAWIKMVLSIILNIVRYMKTIWRKRVLKTFRLNTQMIKFIRLRSKKVLLVRLFFYVSFDTAWIKNGPFNLFRQLLGFLIGICLKCKKYWILVLLDRFCRVPKLEYQQFDCQWSQS
jgi:hypothetical protein